MLEAGVLVPTKSELAEEDQVALLLCHPEIVPENRLRMKRVLF